MTLSILNNRSFQNWVIAGTLGLLGTFQYHRIQFTSRFDTFFGDRGDVRGVVYYCEHWYQWLLGHATLVSPSLFYPTKNTLAYSDFLVGYALPYSIARTMGFGMFSSMQVVVILLTFCNYIACYVLLKRVLRFGLLPSCAGAMFFAFNSPKFFQTGHLQLQYVVFLPLIFACVIAFARKLSADISQRQAAALLSGAATLALFQAVTAFYYLWFFVFWAFLFFSVVMILPRSRNFLITSVKRFWPAMLFAAGVAIVGGALFLLSYLPGIRQGQWYRYDYVIQMVPPWWSLLSMGDGNYLWGWLSAAVIPKPWPATWGELKIGIGLVPSLAWVGILLWSIRRFRASAKQSSRGDDLSSAAPAFLIALIFATTLFYLLGFNYGGGRSPWAYVYNYFPGAKAIRAVSRYVIFLTLPMAIAFSFVIERALRVARQQQTLAKRRAFVSVILLIAAFGIFEQFGVFKVGGTGFSKKAEEAYLNAMAAKLSRDCTAFYVAPGNGQHNQFEYHYDAMLISMIAGVPTLNGSTSQFPKDWFLWELKDPNYEANVRNWIELQQIRGNVCRLEIGPQIEAFDPRAPSPLDDASFFVRQQYLDFAGSEPHDANLAAYVTRLKDCHRDDASCSRENISLEISRNSGFSEDGALIFRLYQIALARPPRYEEFKSDLDAPRTGRDRSRFVDDFTNRAEFVNRYGAISDADYLTNLAQHTDGSLPDSARQALIGKSRAQTLLAIAEDPKVTQKFANRAFVTLRYFGYLGRDPEKAGYELWVNFLDRTGDFSRVTLGFITSVEYRRRFLQ